MNLFFVTTAHIMSCNQVLYFSLQLYLSSHLTLFFSLIAVVTHETPSNTVPK